MTERSPLQNNGNTQSQQSSSLHKDNHQWQGYQTAGPQVHTPNEEVHQRALSLLSDSNSEVNRLSQERMSILENQPPDI